jgi:hypothetical protein
MNTLKTSQPAERKIVYLSHCVPAENHYLQAMKEKANLEVGTATAK